MTIIFAPVLALIALLCAIVALTLVLCAPMFLAAWQHERKQKRIREQPFGPKVPR